jgi:hypothetical protein
MNKALIVIDSYISDKERFECCFNLIEQIRKIFPKYKLGLLNKYPNSWGLEKLVDYYFYYGDGFMVGEPPQYLLDSGLYERGFLFHKTSLGVCENWVPLGGVTDHVASVYNSFVLISRLSKSLGFKKVLKIEYDTDFDLNDLTQIKVDTIHFKDYYLLGKRYEKNEMYIIDVHTMGYDVKLFDGFDLVKNDDDWWELCKKIGYYGKWIEYAIPYIIEYQNKTNKLEGTILEGRCRDNFPNTKFDVINSPGLWTELWRDIPKVCKIRKPNILPEEYKDDEVILYYWNNKDNDLNIKCNVYNINNEIIYNKEIILSENAWFMDTIPLEDVIYVETENTQAGENRKKTMTFNKSNILEHNVLFVHEK